MSISICVYTVATGRILRTVTCASAAVDLQAGDGEAWVDGDASDLAHYVHDGVITERAPIAAICAATWPADGTTPLVISGLPIDARVQWSGPDGAAGELTATAGSVSLITNAPGAYGFTVDEPAYQLLQLTATATP